MDYHSFSSQTRYLDISSVQFSHSVVSDSLQPHCSMPGFPVLGYLPEFAQTHVYWVGDAILCHPLLLLPSIFPSVRIFPSESALRIKWPKYWSFSFSISPSNEYSGLISFKIDSFGLLADQGNLRSLLQHHSLKASILQRSAFFTVHNRPWLLERP